MKLIHEPLQYFKVEAASPYGSSLMCPEAETASPEVRFFSRQLLHKFNILFWSVTFLSIKRGVSFLIPTRWQLPLSVGFSKQEAPLSIAKALASLSWKSTLRLVEQVAPSPLWVLSKVLPQIHIPWHCAITVQVQVLVVVTQIKFVQNTLKWFKGVMKWIFFIMLLCFMRCTYK